MQYSIINNSHHDVHYTPVTFILHPLQKATTLGDGVASFVENILCQAFLLAAAVRMVQCILLSE